MVLLSGRCDEECPENLVHVIGVRGDDWLNVVRGCGDLHSDVDVRTAGWLINMCNTAVDHLLSGGITVRFPA